MRATSCHHARSAGPPHARVGPPHERSIRPPRARNIGPPNARSTGPPHAHSIGPAQPGSPHARSIGPPRAQHRAAPRAASGHPPHARSIGPPHARNVRQPPKSAPKAPSARDKRRMGTRTSHVMETDGVLVLFDPKPLLESRKKGVLTSCRTTGCFILRGKNQELNVIVDDGGIFKTAFSEPSKRACGGAQKLRAPSPPYPLCALGAHFGACLRILNAISPNFDDWLITLATGQRSRRLSQALRALVSLPTKRSQNCNPKPTSPLG